MKSEEDFHVVTTPAEIARLTVVRAAAVHDEGHLRRNYCAERGWHIATQERPVQYHHDENLCRIMTERNIAKIYMCPIAPAAETQLYSIPNSPDFVAAIKFLVSAYDWLGLAEDLSFALTYGEDDYWDFAGPPDIVRQVIGDVAVTQDNLEWDIAHMSPSPYRERLRRRAAANREVCGLPPVPGGPGRGPPSEPQP